jgi:hypothetical protein
MSFFTLSYFFVKNRVFREEIAIPDGQLDLLVFWSSMFQECLLTIMLEIFNVMVEQLQFLLVECV